MTPIFYIAVAGLIGEIFFEVYGWLISPVLFGVTLEPAKLIMALSSIFLGSVPPYWLAFVAHVIIGAALFPALVLTARKLLGISLLMSGLLCGVTLWFVAQGALAPIVGREFMMGFGAYTQSSFIGHVGMTLTIAFALAKLVPMGFAERPDGAAARLT